MTVNAFEGNQAETAKTLPVAIAGYNTDRKSTRLNSSH
mgnify:CR=1 FL=1